MPLLNALTAALAWLGRQGTRAVAASIFLGLAVPQLAAYVKPFLGETVFVMLLFSYLRTDPAAFRSYMTAARLPVLASLWIMIALPLLFGVAYTLSGVREAMPALYAIMILHIAIAPITSSAAFAALMGLDVALSLVALIVASAMSPVTTVAYSYLFLGASVFSPAELGLKLFLFYAASGLVAYVIRRIAGQAWIDRQRDPIDGLNVIAVFVFAIVAMDRVPEFVAADPVFALKLMIFVILLTLTLTGLTMLVFIRIGVSRALVLGLLASFRNLGMVMAAVGSTLSDIAWFYFALVQFPIFLLPAILKPLAGRGFKSREQP